MSAEPKLHPVSVPLSLWRAVADASDGPFADSYLFGAMVIGSTLEPRTVTAYLALRARYAAREAIERCGYTLRRPETWTQDKPRGVEILAGRI